jgi:hypothetical protein
MHDLSGREFLFADFGFMLESQLLTDSAASRIMKRICTSKCDMKGTFLKISQRRIWSGSAENAPEEFLLRISSRKNRFLSLEAVP